jgi:hypothetical protein
MAATVTYDEIQSRSLKVEGSLSWISALKYHFLALLGVKIVLYYLALIERDLDLRDLDRQTTEKIYPMLKDLNMKYQGTAPLILAWDSIFLTRENKKKLNHFRLYLEDVVEALEIGLDDEVVSKIETLIQGTCQAKEIPPWREALGQI